MPRLPSWENRVPDDRVVVIMADSTGELNVAGTTPTYPHLIREKMRERWGLAGSGFLGAWRDEWAFTTGGDVWTNSAFTDVWSKGPMDGVFAHTHTKRANTATKVATWTKPAWMTDAITYFNIHVVDGPSSATFSYRIDGGAWTNVVHTWNQDNALEVITVLSPVNSTVELRGANAAGTNVTMYFTGIEMIYTGSGSTLHDLSGSGEGLVSTGLSGGNADHMAFMDVIQPGLTVVSYTNDLNSAFWNPTSIAADLAEIASRQQPYGYMIAMPFWGQDRSADGVTSAEYLQLAAMYRAAADAVNSETIDLYDRYGDYANVSADGLMDDLLHPSDAGAVLIASTLWPLIVRGDGNAKVRS